MKVVPPLLAPTLHAEVAALVLFLSGPLSMSMTGAIIPFDGGYSAH